MPAVADRVQPPLAFIPPTFNPAVFRLARWLLPWVMRSRTPIHQVQASHVEKLAKLFQQFQAGKLRFLIAFRHPSTSDPFCLMHLLWKLLPQVAREHNISLSQPTHSHFMYDRGVPLWAGAQVAWLFPQLGGTPIHRGKLDLPGLRSARDLFANGQFPLAAAPEGATNGHNEIISPLEPGISQLGFWCVEDLQKAGRSESVAIVPLGIRYRYVEAPWDAVDNLLTQLETDSGLTSDPSNDDIPADRLQQLSGREAALYRRLYRIGEHLLSAMEQFYSRFYRASKPSAAKASAAAEPAATDLATRLQTLLESALQVAEEYFGLRPKGSLIDRCRRLEQAGWDRIYREDLKNIEALSPLERGLANRIAEEASLRMWHMRLVESFVAVTGQYVLEKPTVERFAETALLLWYTMTRIKDGNPFSPPRLGKQKADLTVGDPIVVSDRWEAYKKSRRQAVAQLTQDLQTALEATIG